MNNLEKEKITKKLLQYVEQKGSQNKAANTLTGVSSATLSQIKNRNWELINDEMWNNIAAQIEYSKESWEIVHTRDFKKLQHLFSDSQNNSLVFGITGAAGSGKSKAAKIYNEENKQCYLLSCNEYWNRKDFLTELSQAMGRDASGLTVSEIMKDIVQALKKQNNPIIIMDEADKLKDQVLYFFITLYNQLEDQCGIILLATDHLAKRVTKGIRLNRKGYNEINSRVGRKFIQLKGIGSVDVEIICKANGVIDRAAIKSIWNDCEEDLRRVKRLIHKEKMSN